MKAVRLTIIMFIGMVVSGCFGTIATRHSNDIDSVVGGYPLKAVVYDVDHGSELFSWVSFPFDLVVDVLVSPVDIVAWFFGHKRSYSFFDINRRPVSIDGK